MIADINISEFTAMIWVVVGAATTIIGAVVTGVIKIRNNQILAEEKQKLDQAANSKKLDQIHTETNSNLSAMKEELREVKSLLKERDATITEQKVELAKLQTPSSISMAAPPAPVPVTVVADKPVPVVIEKVK